MTELRQSGHSRDMEAASETREPARSTSGKRLAVLPDFDEIYDTYFDFVWRNLRRWGVREAQLDDASQDVFLVVHRRLADFEQRSSLRTWLFAITQRVAKDYRRTAERRDADELSEDSAQASASTPAELAEQAEAVRLFHELLGALDDERRAVFLMVHVEQMSAPEVAEALGIKLNTVYSRLRLARQDFDSALRRHRLRSQP